MAASSTFTFDPGSQLPVLLAPDGSVVLIGTVAYAVGTSDLTELDTLSFTGYTLYWDASISNGANRIVLTENATGDLYVLNRSGNSWGSPQFIASNADLYSEGVASISADGNTIAYVEPWVDGTGRLKIFKNSGGWSQTATYSPPPTGLYNPGAEAGFIAPTIGTERGLVVSSDGSTTLLAASAWPDYYGDYNTDFNGRVWIISDAGILQQTFTGASEFYLGGGECYLNTDGSAALMQYTDSTGSPPQVLGISEPFTDSTSGPKYILTGDEKITIWVQQFSASSIANGNTYDEGYAVIFDGVSLDEETILYSGSDHVLFAAASGAVYASRSGSFGGDTALTFYIMGGAQEPPAFIQGSDFWTQDRGVDLSYIPEN